MRPDPPAVCFGTVMHHRRGPVDHRFTYPVNLIWIDPDRPDDLFDRHPLWSARRPAPVRFRRTDYLDGSDRPLGPAVRRTLADALGQEPAGPLRMLTQPRTWGWLFNPITIYLAWADPSDGDGNGDGPVAALLEVSNTPWKERHLYPVALVPATTDRPVAGDPDGPPYRYRASFDKVLHVSPFLDQSYRYQLDVAACHRPDRPRRLTIGLDVVLPDPAAGAEATLRIQGQRADEEHGDSPSSRLALATRLVIDQHPVERAMLTQSLRRNPLPTHRVSLGIHRQALRLWRAGVPLVAHPRKRSPSTTPASR